MFTLFLFTDSLVAGIPEPTRWAAWGDNRGRGGIDDWAGMVDSVGHDRGSMDNRSSVVDDMRDDWGSVRNSVMGNRVGTFWAAPFPGRIHVLEKAKAGAPQVQVA